MNSHRITDLANKIDVQKSAIDTLKSELEVIRNQNRDFSDELKTCRERILHLENKNRIQDDRQKPRGTTKLVAVIQPRSSSTSHHKLAIGNWLL